MTALGLATLDDPVVWEISWRHFPAVGREIEPLADVVTAGKGQWLRPLPRCMALCGQWKAGDEPISLASVALGLLE